MVYKRELIAGETGTFNVEASVHTFLSNGAKTLAEIREFLKQKGVTYTPDGVIKLLNRLEKKGLTKKKYRGKKPPIYYLTDKGIQNTGLRAKIYEHNAIYDNLNRLSPLLQYGKEKQFLKKLVDILGLYSMNVYLESWQFIGKPQQFEEKRQLWFYTIRLSLTITMWLDDCLFNFWPEKDKKWSQTKESRISNNKKTIQKFKKILVTLYPKEMEQFNRINKEVDKQVKSYHELVKHQSILDVKKLLSNTS